MIVDQFEEVLRKTALLPLPTGTASASPIAPIPTVVPGHEATYEVAGDAGKKTLWVVFVIMTVASAGFTAMSWKVPLNKRLYHVITTIITITAALSYFAMATGHAVSFNKIVEREQHDHVPDTYATTYRQVYWARYVDWAITTPLLLLDLGLLAGMSGGHMFMMMTADLIMILTGLFAGFGSEDTQKWGWYTISCIAFLFIFWHLVLNGGANAKAKGDICDVVVVSTPNMTHYEILMDIINHPKPHHVLVEKPLCTNVSDCKKVITAAKTRSDMLVQVGLEYRYMPPVAKLIDIVKEGALGQVKMVSIREHRFPFLVKVDNWNRFNCNTGGTLVEKCCHFFDLMRLFIGANPVRVMASGAMDLNHKEEVYDGRVPDIIDNAYVIVEFDNGCRGLLDLCMFAEGSKNEQEISVVGDTGKGEALVPESIVRWGTRAEGRNGVQTLLAEDKRIKYDGLHHGSSYLEHLQFLSAVRARGEQAPAVGLHDGLVSVAIGVAAQLSIQKGRSVTIEEVMHEQLLQSTKS